MTFAFASPTSVSLKFVPVRFSNPARVIGCPGARGVRPRAGGEVGDHAGGRGRERERVGAGAAVERGAEAVDGHGVGSRTRVDVLDVGAEVVRLEGRLLPVVGDGVVARVRVGRPRAPVRRVRAGAAVQGVAAVRGGFLVEGVVAVAAVLGVVAAGAVERVRAGAPGEDVGVGVPRERVAAAATGDVLERADRVAGRLPSAGGVGRRG